MAPQEKAQGGGLEQALSQLEQRVAKQVRAVRSGNMTFLIVGVVLAVVVAGYLNYMVGAIANYIKEPGTLAALVKTQIENQLPGALDELRSSVKGNAPKWIDDGRKELMAQVPKARQNLEKRVVDYAAKETRAALQGQLDKIIKDMLRDHKADLEPLIAKAAEETGPQQLADEFTKLFDKSIGDLLKEKLEPANKTLKEMADYMKRLHTAPDLTEREKIEKEWITDFVNRLSHVVAEVAMDPYGKKPAPPEPAKE